MNLFSYIGIFTVMLTAASCEKSSRVISLNKSDSASDKKLVTSSAEGATVSSTVNSKYRGTQYMEGAPGTATEGATMTFPIGSLSINANVSMGAGDTLANGAMASGLGMSTSFSGSGSSVKVGSDPAQNTLNPFILSIPVPSGTSLTGDMDKLVIIYEQYNAATKAYIVGLMTPDMFTVEGTKIKVKISKFGTYQPAYTVAKVTAPVTKDGAAKDVMPTDSTAPTIINIKPSVADGTYAKDQKIGIYVKFSETVTVTGIPKLSLAFTSGAKPINYVSGSGTNQLLFEFTVGATDVSADLDYSSTTPFDVSASKIVDAAGNAAVLTMPAPGAVGSLGANAAVVVIGNAITVTSVSSTQSSGSTFGIGASVQVSVIFSDTVVVTGTPQITLETGATDAVATYTGGNNSLSLTFTFTVMSGMTAAPLDYINVNALVLSGGTITSVSGTSASLTLPTLGGGSSLAVKNLTVDGIAPTATFTSINPVSPSNNAAPTLSFTTSETSNVVVWNAVGCSGSSLYTSGSASTSFTTSVTAAADSNTLLYVNATDLVGNSSCTLLTTYTHDSIAANTPTIIIDGGASYTNDAGRNVTLTLSGSDAAEMYITNTASCTAGGTWEVFSATKAGWMLSAPNSTNTVYVKVRDSAQNESTCQSDSIVHDSNAPAGFSVTGPSASTIYNTTPTITWTASSGHSSYSVYVATVSGCGSGVVFSSTSIASGASSIATTTLTPNTYYICMNAVDAAGNSTAATGRSFVLANQDFTCTGGGDFDTACTVTTPVTTSSSNITINGSLIINGTINVTAPSTITVAGAVSIGAAGSLNGNITLNAPSISMVAGAKISADVLGGAGGANSGDNGHGTCGGLSSATSGGGGCFGGAGASASSGGSGGTATYGSATAPGVVYGSGGGAAGSTPGGAGGGSLVINVTGLLALPTSATISANGADGAVSASDGSGGGSGGAITIVAGSVSGTGSITANGGSSAGTTNKSGAGGGGRIRFESSNKFTGLISVAGGSAASAAQAGIDGSYTQLVNNFCDSGSNAWAATCTVNSPTWMGDGETLSILGSLSIQGNNTIQNVSKATSGYRVAVAETFTVGSTFTWTPSGTMLNAKDVLLDLSATTMTINGMMVGNFPSIRAQNITIANTASAGIEATGWGSIGGAAGMPGQGLAGGLSASSKAAGGSGCGLGGSSAPANPQALTGVDNSMPDWFGSGGAGGVVAGAAGGGHIKIIARGTLTILGSSSFGILANGANAAFTGQSGGGSGGSIWIDANSLNVVAGNDIQVNGGNAGTSGAAGGGGGAGCIAVYAKTIVNPGGFGISGGIGGANGATGNAAQVMYANNNPGARKVFVSSSTYSLNNQTAMNSGCSAEASSAGFWAGTWKAVVSTGALTAGGMTTSPISNTWANVRLLNSRGENLGYSNDFFTGPTGAINYFADGSAVPGGTVVATGGNSSGAASGTNCTDFGTSASNVSYSLGNPLSATSGWFSTGSTTCDNAARVICVSQ